MVAIAGGILLIAGILAAIGVIAGRAPYEGPAADYFVDPKGYEYREPATQTVEAARQGLFSDPAVKDAISHFDLREVLGNDGAPAAAVIVVLIDAPPDQWEEAHAGIVRGIEKESGIELEESTIGGVDAMVGAADSIALRFLSDKNLIILVGGDADRVDDVAEAQAEAFD